MNPERSAKSLVLLVCTSRAVKPVLAKGLEAQGFDVVVATSYGHALMEAAAQQYPLILFSFTDSPEESNTRINPSAPSNGVDANEHLQTLKQLRRLSPASQVIVLMTGNLNLAVCCQAVRFGASSFVEWSEGDSFTPVVERLHQALKRYDATIAEGREMHAGHIFDETGVATRSQVMAKLLFQAKRAALISDAPILICGESGTGKQLLSEAIHRMDPKRSKKPFLTVNCAAITGSLAESALFGHRKGAFTGATEDRLGYFRAANGGTILLDEISELEKSLQPKLLRVLQEGFVLPVGDDAEKVVDVRVIAASNRPLPLQVEKGEFRLDLYQRLNVISLNVPPLRDRPEDIPLLVQFFLGRYASYYAQPIESVDERVYEVLAQTIGSGNIRELENAVRQILAFKTGGTRIELSDIPPQLLEKQSTIRAEADVTTSLTEAAIAMIRSGQITLPEMLEEIESMILSEALVRSGVSHSELARQLGLSRRTFYNKLKKHDLPGTC